MLKNAVIITLLGVIAVGGTFTTVGAQGNTEATVEVRVWQSLEDAERLYISARPESGSWATLGTIRLPLDDGRSSDGRFMYGDIRLDVPLADRPPVTVEVRVWQHSLRLERVYVSARPAFGSWATLGTIRLPLVDGQTASFRYGDIRVGVPYVPISDVPITFWGDFSEERQAEIRDETLSVVAYFADRYGLLDPDFELHVGADAASLAQARRDVLGTPNPSPLVCGKAVNEQVFVLDWCATASHDNTYPLAHEYFHVLQAALAAGAAEPIWVADWLLEGTAEYAAIEYSIARGLSVRAEVEDNLLKTVTSEPFDLAATEGGIPQFDLAGYQRAAFATSYLVGQTGEADMVDFFRALPRLLDWRAAFAEAFGKTTDEFYADFAFLVEGLSPGFVNVVLKVLDPDGNNLSHWNGAETRVKAYSDAEENTSGAAFQIERSAATVDGAEGFHFAIPEGDYRFVVRLGCQRFDGESFDVSVLEAIAQHPAEGSMPIESGREVIVQLPGWPPELNIHCSDRERYQIRGVMVSSRDHDVTEYLLSARPIGIMGAINLAGWGEPFRAKADGTFEIPVPDGYDYRLHVKNACLLEVGYYASGRDVVHSVQENTTVYSEDGTSASTTIRTVPPEEATVVSVDGAAVSGIRIQLPEVIKADEWNERLREMGVCSP